MTYATKDFDKRSDKNFPAETRVAHDMAVQIESHGSLCENKEACILSLFFVHQWLIDHYVCSSCIF